MWLSCSIICRTGTTYSMTAIGGGYDSYYHLYKCYKGCDNMHCLESVLKLSRHTHFNLIWAIWFFDLLYSGHNSKWLPYSKSNFSQGGGKFQSGWPQAYFKELYFRIINQLRKPLLERMTVFFSRIWPNYYLKGKTTFCWRRENMSRPV